MTMSENDKAEGLAARAMLFSPAPMTGSSKVGFGAAQVKVILCPVQPWVVGVKVTPTFRLCPGCNTTGKERLEVVNAELLDEIPVIVTVVEPLLVKVASKV
jgi:hypothetical protein